MDIRHLTVTAAALAAIFPAICSANPENVALHACARAFASSIAAPGSASPSYTVHYRGGQSQSALGRYYNRDFTFYLQAHSPKSDRTIARATCSADMNGTVVSLQSELASTSSPALAAKF
jgi:hypothetical protein